ncbi:MAG: glycosyltransferase, partial [Anaerolineae bacterium]
MVDLSVVIVNWNVGDLLRRCLQSIRNPTAQLGSERATVTAPAPCASDPELETIVVDNGSSDGSVTMVRENFPDVRIIANEDNRGFPAANNQGMAVAQGRHILLLNP